MDELATLTADLVSVPSHEDETAAGDFIEEWLRDETDADVTRDAAGNVVATRGTGDRSLALVGHHDVVPPAPEQRDGEEYVVSERGGRIYGRGAADMKGAVAAAMLAFRDGDPRGDADGSDDAACELVFASFVGEERGGVGARAAIDAGFRPDCAIVGEGSTNYSGPDVTDVVVAHKGRRGSTVTATGAAAHASEPEAGENAIYRAADAVDVVRGLEFPAVEVFGEELRGSVAVTEIAGGTAWNVVPDECALTVDERTVPGEYAPLERVEELPGVSWTVDQDLPPMRCDDDAFAELVLDCAADAQAGDPELVTKPHATDAGWLAAAGTACVIVGASEPGEAHTEDESVGLDALARCYRTYRAAAERFA